MYLVPLSNSEFPIIQMIKVSCKTNNQEEIKRLK